MATKKFFKKNKKLVIAVTGIVVTLLFLIILFLSLFNININLNGSPKETIEYGDTYTEQGATAAFNTPASKNVPLNVTIKGSVDSSKLGTYHIHYKAKKGIFSAQKSREVKIVDTKAPIIELNKIDGYYPKTGETYQEEGFTATDNYDGDITSKIKRTEDKNVITYTVSDSSGNKTSVQRTIEYNDGIAPTITLNGDSDITIKAGTRFEDPGCTAKDSHGNDISDSVSVSDNISTYRAGTYTITYSVTDKFGNETSIDRTVTVEAVKQTATTSSGNKVVYLTFDDGPSVNTADVLDILKSNDIKATFFVLGTQVEKMPEMVKRAYQEGHYIANHGYSHQYSQIYSSPETVLQEFNQCNSSVAKAIDVPEYNSHLFRFPGGSVGGKYANLKAEAVTLLEQNNIMHVDWNALTGDAEKSSPDEEYLMNNLQKTTQNKNSIVILMHDAQAKRVTVEFLPKLIEFFQQQGYQFENFYSIIK